MNHFQNSDAQNIRDIGTLKQLYNGADLQDRFEIGRILYKRYKEVGNISASVMLLNELKALKPSAKFISRELQINLDKILLLTDSSYLAPELEPTSKNFKTPEKVLHVLNTSVPYLKNGYSIRSKYIVENQKKLGMEPVVLTRPGFPNDFYSGLIASEEELIPEWENQIRYYRCLPKLLMRHTPLKTYLQEYANQIGKVIENESPGILHAASNYVNGLPALEAARAKKLPFVYEIRGFWELTTLSKEPLFKDSEEFQLAQKMETYLACSACRVITICKGLQAELVERGVNPDKIQVIPNGVDCELFKPLPPNPELSKQYRLENNFVIGYIGSITKYEGLQILLKVIGKLKTDGYKLKCLIVGDGDYLVTLKQLTAELNLGSEVIFVDHIPHHLVVEYYALFDLCIYPRLNEEVTRLVTPLKPLEAMACGKPVIGPELAAISEMIIPDVNGIIFDNSEINLYRKIKIIYENDAFRAKLKTSARKWVLEHRDWHKLSQDFQSLYLAMVK